MSGEPRLLREGNRAPSFLTSRLNFGAVAFVLLAVIAIVLTLMFPEIQLQPPELLVGP
jgi:TRAP-type mannitol/chloroaromatic compound transport system permease large subunit